MTEIFVVIKLVLRNAGLSITPVANKYYKWLPYSLILASSLFLPPSMDYGFRYQLELKDITQTFYISCACQLLLSLRFYLIWQNLDTVKDIINAFQRIVNDRSSPCSAQMYAKARKMSDFSTKVIVTMFKWLVLVALIITPILKLVSLALGLDWSISWELPFSISFGTMDMARWPALLMSYLIISIVAFSSYMIYTIPETLFINFCLFVTATLKDIRLTIVQIGAESSSLGLTSENHRSLEKRWTEIIRLHCEVSRILQMVSKLFNGIIFVTLATNVAMLCTALFQLTLSVSEWQTAMLAQNIEVVFVTLACIYFFCYFCEMINGHMQAIAEVIYTDSGWHDHPPQLRRHFLMVMRASQQPVFFSAFGLRAMTCSMENFCNLMNTARSSLTVLRSALQ